MILIAGPCVIDSITTEQTAEAMKPIITEFKKKDHRQRVGYIEDFYFKASCVKDNRTKPGNYRGPGFSKGLDILEDMQIKFDYKITTDFHSVNDIEMYGKRVDLIQIPAFLARQTSILEAAAKTGVPVHVKKPQMMLPNEVNIISDILKNAGADTIFITDRGTFSGGKHLYMDPRHYEIMKMISGVTILADITHPNKFYLGNTAHNNAEILGGSAIISGADGIFMEVHSSPRVAFCDKDTQIETRSFRELMRLFTTIEEQMNDHF